MRRNDIQLLSLARQGDAAARCEAGRRYLLGVDGFPKHVATGLDYLTLPSVGPLPQAARIIAESLALEDILLLNQQAVLLQAAEAGSATAQVKLAAWLCVRHGRLDESERWLVCAGAAGHGSAPLALTRLRDADSTDPMTGLLRALMASGDLKGPVILMIAVKQALAEHDLARTAACLRTAITLSPLVTAELAELISAHTQLAEQHGAPLAGIEVQAIESALDMRTHRGDREAAYTLGRALCAIPCGALAANTLATGSNMRKGVALLLRAADAGRDDAWLHLYRMHGDHSLSVANPQMARFCLEKAALAGLVEARRKLGALMLRGADTLPDTEQAIHWLHLAAGANDAHACSLLQSLVLPLSGDNDHAQAMAAIELVRRDDPWLAMRMELARQYGLTKLEALCVDPAEGQRPWGLVVGKNPFISQVRLSAPRAVPALTALAADTLQRAASFFAQASRDAFEGDLRRRSLRQRRMFERHGLNDTMFFATASSMTLEALRFGPKWAFRAKRPLQLALAA